jgi:heme exporter protein A
MPIMSGNPFASPLPPQPFPLMLRDVTAVCGETRVFSGLDMAIDAGGLWLVRGANGAGKTTLLRLLAGLLRPASGASLWGDGRAPRAVPERATLVGHQEALKPALTAAENLAFWARFAGVEENPWPTRSDPFSVWALADVPLRTLSAGQKRRVSLTRLAFARAPLWLLDEPTTALDAAGQRTVWELIAAHRRRGGAVVVTTHAKGTVEGASELHLGDER